MKVAVTGATGFIGQYVIQQLLSSGHTVTAIGRDETKLQKTFLNKPVQLHVSNYKVENLRDAFVGADAVVHLAAKRAGYDGTLSLKPVFNTNNKITQNMFKAAISEKVPYISQSSSIAVYPLTAEAPYTEEQRPTPANMYGMSKLVCENMGEIINSNRDISVSSLRIGSTFGLGERTGDVIMKFIHRAKKNKPLVVYGAGKSARDFVYVYDVVSAIERMLSTGEDGIFNIGGGEPYSMTEVAEIVNTVYDNVGNLQHDKEKNENGDIQYMDCSKARDAFDWQPEYSLSEALTDMKNKENTNE